MGAFAGCASDADVAALVPRMLPAATRRAGRLAVSGERDVDICERGPDALAIVGHVRIGKRAITAADALALWCRRGPDALASFAGEFALAVARDRRVWIARDRVGTRPLYVATARDGAIVFSTSMRCLLATGVSPAFDHDAIVRSLILGYVPAPQTAIAAIEQIGAGECWQISPARVIHRYYRPRERIARGRGLAGAAHRLDRALDHAVDGALPAEGRLGAFLSGGLDSSLVLARVHARGRPVDAFTLHFGDTVPNELRYAQAVARHLGVPHHVLELDARTFVAAIEPALVELEDLLSEPIAVPNFLLAREAARRVDVLFTGEGGDPLFGGPKNIGLVLSEMYAPNHAPSLADSYCAAHHHLFDDLDVALAPQALRRFDRDRLYAEVIEPHVGDRAPADTFVGRMMTANLALKGANNILVKVAKMVGAHDLALRSPLFAREVVDVAMSVPPWQKLSGSDEKLVMKRVAARALPAAVVNRPKRGMGVPLARWLRADLGELARDVLTARAVRDRGLFRWEYVSRLLAREDHPSELARSRAAEKLWLVLVTELYLATLARAEAAPVTGSVTRGARPAVRRRA